jgi:hypothetical protein
VKAVAAIKRRPSTERQKLARDLEEQIKLRELRKSGPPDAWKAAIKKLAMRKGQLSAADLKARDKAWREMGLPGPESDEFLSALNSPEWRAKLIELKSLSKRRQGKQPAPPSNTDPSDDPNSLYWRHALLTMQQAAALKGRGAPIDLVDVPGQRQERHTKEQQAEARRMYRWLWRNFPGLLRACDPELRKLIRRAGGIA